MPGKADLPRSIKNPDTYQALKRQGFSKGSAAAISNSALAKGFKKGKHRKPGERGKPLNARAKR